MALNRLNLTTRDELRKINILGEKLADRICDDGPFESFKDLKNIRGVDPDKRKKTIQTIEKYFSISGFDGYISCKDLQNRDIGSDKLFILHVNARSLQNKEIIDKLRNLIDPLSHKPDVICVSESRNLTDQEASLDGYTFECKPNENNPSSVGGVAIYVKDSIESRCRDDLILKGGENIWLNITWNSTSYVVGAIYRHPETKIANKNDFKNSLRENIKELKKNKEVFYILGDFNLNLQNDHDIFIKHYRDMLKNLGAVQLIRPVDTTREAGSSSMLLDHIVTNDHTESGKISGIIKTDCISDHYPVYVIKQQIPH